MTIQDVEYIQELEKRISVLENNIDGKVDLLTLMFLVFAIALFIGSIVLMFIMFNYFRKRFDDYD